jgi:hypothetical protein
MQPSTLNEEGRKERRKEKRKPNQPSVFYPPSLAYCWNQQTNKQTQKWVERKSE